MSDTKTCQLDSCGVEFTRVMGISAKEWGERRFCSRECYRRSIAFKPGQCQRPGCENLLGHRARRYCSLSCAGKVQAAAGRVLTPPRQQPKPRPPCDREGCDTPVPSPVNRYCSRSCAQLARRQPVCPNGHERTNPGACKTCKRVNDTARRERRRAERGPGAAEAGRSKPPPPPSPIPVVTQASGQAWRPAGIDRWPARGGPGDPAPRRVDGAAGDTTPVGVSAGAAGTVPLVGA